MLWNFESPYDSLIPKWSQARLDAWNLCERMYYYQYRAVSIESRHLSKNDIISLRRRRTIQRARGEIVHIAIAELLRNASDGKEMDVAAIIDKTWRNYMATPEKVLVEFANGHGLTGALLDQARADCARLLEKFIDIWAQYNSDDVVYIDNHDTYPGWFLCGNIAVYARPDLIVKRDKYLIIDWKTGAEPDDYADNILEMSTSIYLACFDFDGRTRADLERVEGAFVYLQAEKMSPIIQRTQDDFETFVSVVEEKVDIFPLSFVEEHYIPDPARWKCRACNFATICHDGRLLLD